MPDSSQNDVSGNYRFLTVDEIQSLPDPEWLIGENEPGKGLIPQNSLTVLYGPPGVGKTFLALDWSACVAAGKPWFDFRVKRGNVLYVCAEGAFNLKSRIAAWEINRDRSLSDEANIAFCPMAVNFDKPDAGTKFVAEAFNHFQWVPDLIVVDTLARCYGDRSENDASDMSAFVNCMDRMRQPLGDCSILLVHHSGKGNSSDMRGSSALRGAADAVYALTGKTEKTLSLKCDKQKDAEPFIDRGLSLDAIPCGDNLNSCVFAETGLREPTRRSRDLSEGEKNEQRALDILGLSDDEEARLKHGEWKRRWESKGNASSTFDNVLGRLIKKDLVMKDESDQRWTLTFEGKVKVYG